MSKTYYMIVTKDKYELPLCVTESLQDMSRITGVSYHSLWTAFAHYKKKKGKSKYRMLTVDDE